MPTPIEPETLRLAQLRFYTNPSPDLVEPLLDNDLAAGVFSDFENPQAFASLYFYARIIREYADIESKFKTLAQSESARGEVAQKLFKLSSRPEMPDPLTMDLDSVSMDMLWMEYSATGNASAVRRIVSVLDWDDVVRARLNPWLQKGPPKLFGRKKYEATCRLLYDCLFPIDFERRIIDEPVDLDLHVAASFQSGALKADQLPIQLSGEEWQKLGTKSAAIWSLSSFASEDPKVAEICEEEAGRPGGAGRLQLIPHRTSGQ